MPIALILLSACMVSNIVETISTGIWDMGAIAVALADTIVPKESLSELMTLWTSTRQRKVSARLRGLHFKHLPLDNGETKLRTRGGGKVRFIFLSQEVAPVRV